MQPLSDQPHKLAFPPIARTYRVHRFLGVLGLLGGLSLLTVRAFAQGSDADRATARALAAEGNQALKRKEYETAEDRFRRADALLHAPTLVVDHARALVGLGRLAEAYDRYALVLKEGVEANAPWAWKAALKNAKEEIEALEPKLAWLSVTVAGPSDPQVTIDGRAVLAGELGARRAVDPGRRTISASAPGFLPNERTLELEAGQEQGVTLELLPEPTPPPLPPPKKTIVRVKAPPAPEKDYTLAYVAFGAGGAGLLVGSIAGVLFLNQRAELNKVCPTEDTCPAGTKDLRDRYYLYSYTSAIGLGVGLAGAGLGLALMLKAPDVPAGRTESSVSVFPYLSAEQIGIRGRF